MKHEPIERVWIPWTEEQDQDGNYLRWILFGAFAIFTYVSVVFWDQDSLGLLTLYGVAAFVGYMIAGWAQIWRREAGGYWAYRCVCPTCSEYHDRAAASSAQGAATPGPRKTEGS